MSLDGLDPILQPPKRLAITALLNSAASVEFAFLREHLDLSDSDLSKQMSVLAGAGYVAVTKTRPGRGGTTTYRITRDGRKAFTRHRTALAALLDPTAAPTS